MWGVHEMSKEGNFSFLYMWFVVMYVGGRNKRVYASRANKLSALVARKPRKTYKEPLGPHVAKILDSKMRPEVPGESTIDRWERFHHNGVALLMQCVQPGTQGTYAVGWRRWVDFNNWFGTDPWLRTPPADWASVRGGGLFRV